MFILKNTMTICAAKKTTSVRHLFESFEWIDHGLLGSFHLCVPVCTRISAWQVAQNTAQDHSSMIHMDRYMVELCSYVEMIWCVPIFVIVGYFFILFDLFHVISMYYFSTLIWRSVILPNAAKSRILQRPQSIQYIYICPLHPCFIWFIHISPV